MTRGGRITYLLSVDKDAGRRVAILDAARRCADRAGLRATSLRDVAREAGITQPLIHYYFRTRDRLFEELVASLLDEHLDRFQADLERAGPERRRVGLGSLRRKVLGDKRAWRLLFEVLATPRSAEHGRALAARFARRRALVAEHIGGRHARAKALVLDALMLGLAAERLAGTPDEDIEAALDAFEALLA